MFIMEWSNTDPVLIVRVCTPQGGKATAVRPHLRIIDPNMDFYDEISNDALSIRGFQGYRCNDYHLGNYHHSLVAFHFYYSVIIIIMSFICGAQHYIPFVCAPECVSL